jgi:glycosyltransferase involved in cell wall biosynthesis
MNLTRGKAQLKKPSVIFNGKFLVAGPTGVHRVAEQLICHLDRLLDSEISSSVRWKLLIPKSGRRTLTLKHIPCEFAGKLRWQFWEQFELPFFARGSLLINLCNLAPLIRRGDIVMIHDAQVFISPQSYSFLFRTWYRFALPRLGASAARILTVSNFSREKLVDYGVAPRGKISVIYNGIDHQSMADADIGYLIRAGLKPLTYVVALANTQKHKNIEHLLKVFAGKDMQGLKLVLVGNGQQADFEKRGWEVPSNVVFQGHVNDAELRALYEGAICFAFPSTTEGFGLPPLEAMWAGCPAVVAPCGALPEVCGTAAVYAAPDDVRKWQEAIIRLRDDVPFRQSVVAAGREQAAKFTWEKSVRQLLDIIFQTLEAKSLRDDRTASPLAVPSR